MFRKQDFKKVDLLGSGKKNTKIYKAEHIPTGKIYAIKEVEAKTLEKLNEYKVSGFLLIFLRKRRFSYIKFSRTQWFCSSSATISTRLCTTHTDSRWCVNTWNLVRTLSTCFANENNRTCFGRVMR